MKLTAEETARILGLYWGADMVEYGGHGQEYPCKVDADTMDRLYNVRIDFKLILKPLSAITDEDAATLSVVLLPKDYEHLHGAPTGKTIAKTIASGRQTNLFYTHARMADGFAYLIQQGYAVPLFIAPNHPLNGKTAIEIGLAIDSTL